MFEVIAYGLLIVVSAIVMTKVTDKPQTPLAKEVYNRNHKYNN